MYSHIYIPIHTLTATFVYDLCAIKIRCAFLVLISEQQRRERQRVYQSKPRGISYRTFAYAGVHTHVCLSKINAFLTHLYKYTFLNSQACVKAHVHVYVWPRELHMCLTFSTTSHFQLTDHT